MKFDADDRAIDYQIVEANPAFEAQTGLKNASGQWVSDFAPNLERHWFDIYGRVALTGRSERFENHAEVFRRWYDVEALRIGDPEQRRVAILFNNITERRETELRQAFLLNLTDAFRTLTDPHEVIAVATRMIADEVAAVRVAMPRTNPRPA